MKSTVLARTGAALLVALGVAACLVAGFVVPPAAISWWRARAGASE